MGLSKNINKLEQKPLSIRIAILITMVGIAMLIILSIWYLQLKYEFGNKNTSETQSLFKSIRESISNSIKKVQR